MEEDKRNGFQFFFLWIMGRTDALVRPFGSSRESQKPLRDIPGGVPILILLIIADIRPFLK